MGISSFRCSDGWLNRFFKRNKLSLRRITTSGRDLPSDSEELIKSFIDGCCFQILRNNIASNKIVNMDEASIYLDSFSEYTYDERGKRRVRATTTGNEKTRISVLFSATAAGRKVEGEKSFTRFGNMRSPGYALAIQWISEVWAQLDAELIKKSFDLCGITQSNINECHLQLKAFIQKGMTAVVLDEDGADDVRGFGSNAACGKDDGANNAQAADNDDDGDDNDDDEDDDEFEDDLTAFG